MKRLLLYLFYILIHVCAGAIAMAQTDHFRHVSIDEGLAGDCVYRILKDSRGLTWVGTNRGVSLYDGQHVTSIPCDVRRSMNLVHDIVELSNGNIVVAMRAGLFQVKSERVKSEKLELVACPLSISVTDARSLLVMGDTLLVGSAEGLMMVQPENDWHVQPLTLGNSRMARDNRIVDLCTDGKKGAWVISSSSLFHVDSNMQTQREEVDFGSVRDGLRCVCSSNGQVYIGTSWEGLLRYDPVQHTLNKVDEVKEGVVADLNADTEGHLFVALDGAGALELSPTQSPLPNRGGVGGGAIRHYSSATGLPTNGVYTFWREEKTGLSFFGFYRYGMAHSLYCNPTVETYRYGAFDSREQHVRSFCIHAPWKAIGTREGLWLINEQDSDIRHFGHDEMGGSNVLSIAWFAGRFVVATFDGGLCYIDPYTSTRPPRRTATRPTEEVLRKGNFTKVSPCGGGDFLMAISDRVIILNDSMHIQAQYDSRNSELSGAVLTDFIFDKTGKAWLSGANGLALYDPANGVIQRTGFPDGFFNKEICMSYALDKHGDVLAVSENGLFRSSPDLSRWDSLDLADKLDVGTISFIAPQLEGYWVGTDRGLFLMDSLFERFRHIGLAEGLNSLFCNPQSCLIDSAGDFWFSTWRGLHRVKRRPTPDPSRRGRGEAGAQHTFDNYPEALPSFTGGVGGGSFPVFFPYIIVDGRHLPLSDCIRISTQVSTLSAGWNFGQEHVEMDVMMLDYADGRGRYIEWSIDDGPIKVATERRPIRISGLWLGRHKLHIYHPGEPNAQTFTISVWPNAAFWFEVAFVLLLLISIPLLIGYQRRVMRARALRKRKRAIEMELHAREAVERHIQEEQQQRQEAEEARRAAMYQRSRSSQEEYRRLLRELKRFMEDERPYRQADLRVADVARALHTTPNKLSQMLSQHAEVTFYDFINDYRIEEFKRRALDDKYTHLSTLAIAEKCGFKKTTFYSAFAKKEGCTPAEWLARQGKKR